MPLPPELADRFAVVEDLSSGVEADVAVVEGIDDGSRRVLKLYREGFSPDEKAVDRLVRADDWTHVVKIFEVGWSWGGERFYEILEYCEQGSLRSLLVEGGRPALNDVVGQLAAALEFVHGPDVHVVHRDLKPENLFLRTLSPLELALGDFGVVRSVDGSVRWTMGWGTPEYAPPEFEGGEVSAAWDWWSLGMIAAELAVGRHLFALPDGTMPDPRQIRSSLAQRPVDLSEVADARVRLLCQGLLTRDRHHRWGGPQVTEWLEGGSPSVVSDQVNTTSERRRTVLFAGIEHDSPSELARSFQQHWAEAQRHLFQERDQTLVEEVERLLRQHQLDEANRLLASPSSASEIPRHFASLLAEMDPDLEPLYDGIRLTPAGLESAAVEVIRAGGDHPNSKVLDEVRRQNVLIRWRALPGMADASDLQQGWIDADSELEKVLGSVGSHGYTPTPHDWALARAWVLACTVNPEHQHRQLSDLVTALDPTTADQQSWWHALRYAENPGPCQLVATLLTHPSAVSQTHQQEAAARQREEERRESERRARQVEHERIRAARRRTPVIEPMTRSLLVIGGISVSASVVGSIWAATSFETVGGSIPYLHALKYLFHLAIVFGSIALAASWIFDIASWWNARDRFALLDCPAWQIYSLVGAAVLPALLIFVIHWGKPFRTFGGTQFGPPTSFWIWAPACMCCIQVLSLCIREAAEHRVDVKPERHRGW